MLLTLLLAVGQALGCSGNPACDAEVQDRLLRDCSLLLVQIPADICNDGTAQALVDESNLAGCNARDLTLDVECLKTAPCEDIAVGMCSTAETGPQTEANLAKPACRRDCDDVARTQAFDCRGDNTPNQCIDCIEALRESGKRCADAC